MDHVKRTHADAVALDVGAAVSHARSLGAVAVYTVGFCFGGRQSFNQAAGDLGLAGVIGFYGAPQRREPDDVNAPMDLVAAFTCPVLGLFGGADQGIPQEAIDAFDVALSGQTWHTNWSCTRARRTRSSIDRSRSTRRPAPMRGAGC